jgi:hypothetical protein
VKIRIKKTEDYIIMTLVGINKRSNENVDLTISGARHINFGYKRGFVVIEYVNNLTPNPKGTRTSLGYGLPWYEDDRDYCEFSQARKDGFIGIRKIIGYTPKGFTVNFDRFLALVYEDRRRGEIERLIDKLITFSNPEEIARIMNTAIVRQVMKA